MNKHDFLHIIDTYGANPQKWPESAREAATAALKHYDADQDVRAALKRANALDAWLDIGTLPAQGPSDLLKRRILNSLQALPPQNTSQRQGWQNTPKRQTGSIQRYKIAAMMIAAFTVGFIGSRVSTPLSQADGPDPMLVAEAQLADQNPDPESEWVEIADNLGVSDVYSWVAGESDDAL